MKDKGRIIAIGDIHGHYSPLKRLIEEVCPGEDDTIVFLGDYIDRGPDSYKTLEYLIDLKEEIPGEAVMLRGNHEDLVLSFFKGNLNPTERELWLKKCGGDRTIASYRREGKHMDVHREFLESLPYSWETEDYFFCHAGVRPGVPLHRQSRYDLLNMREPFLSSDCDFGKVVVHGHQIVPFPTIERNRININTGVEVGGPISAIDVVSMRIWQQS